MKKILVVDDNLMARELIVAWLINFYDYDISEASSLHEAKKLISKHHFDFIICDYEMPNGNRDDVFNFIKSQKKVIPFVFFAGNAELKRSLMMSY